ncbi:MAG TPA: patatin-like phospholipase family protein [Pyrinomonadaceae bacterium]|nr:patatin-like phospholipase family protein [Pyrinomonadaceae bacterium]
MSLVERLTAPGPKRILSLDGGGIRGALSLGYLRKIEQILRERHNKPDLLLSDYFDLIGGASTGAIIAAALAIGKEVAEIEDLYLRLGDKVFTKHKWWRWGRWWRATFDPEQLRTELRTLFGHLTLGHREERPLIENGVAHYIKTGLCVVVKRADTGSTWPLINHPSAAYYDENAGMLLRKVIRASTAAPTYFEPETIDVGAGQIGVFVDGGVSMANNPSLQLFLIATLQGFRFNWSTGEDKLLVVSVGTGTWKPIKGIDAVTGASKLNWADRVPSIIMNDANKNNQLILQYLSRTATPWKIDGEVGDLSLDLLTPQPALTYLRYNALLETNHLNQLGLSALVPRLDSLRRMEIGKNVRDLIKIGEAAAEIQAQEINQHLPPAFDLP